ncbi:MAG: fibronectin type III domain-containing protein, partial [bacterium]
MQNPNDTTRVHHEIKTSFGLGLTVCSLLMWLLFTPNLYGRIISSADPSGLTATALSSRQIDLSWTDDASDEDGFKIERKQGAAGTYTKIRTTSADASRYADTGLAEGTQYFHRVSVYNASGNSGYSHDASVTALPDSPSAPIALV